MIGAAGVHKSYEVGRDQVEILHGISLEVRETEMVAVMGPSGSGKSTLMYCLAGLEDATQGQVVVNGVDLAGRSRAELAKMRRSELGFMFQSYNLVPTLTASENVELPYLLAGTKPPKDLVRETLEQVGLDERRDARPSSMSGGEQQRVALARVMAQQPKVLFADEPTGALDTRMGGIVLEALGRIAHSPGQCALIVTHDPNVAAECDRVLFLRDGRLVQELTRPDAAAVAAQLTALTPGA
ncbi:ABC transporter ATP-binding protein [Aestuariimicrobium sp. Y1814]|uniref:ABC transporter ATP-binding protein n=1 Tax=Aestuariimicrobium sp. Y1814 TaxID=3418742 RepID=UPI003DA78BBC